MDNTIKAKLLATKTIDEFEMFEDDLINDYRNKTYNELIKDEKVEKHLTKIFNVEKELLSNVLMINGNAPIDDFNE